MFSNHFLVTSILFSSDFRPENEEKILSELHGCMKNIGLSWTELMKMTIRDRRLLIKFHNISVNDKKQKFQEQEARHSK